MVPLRATVAVPELQLSTSWVDFGTCFVNEGRVREVYLMNLSGCRSYWTVLMGAPCAAGPGAPGRGLCTLFLQPGSPGLVPPGNPCRGGQVPILGDLCGCTPEMGERTSWGGSWSCLPLSVLPYPWCRPAGARQGPCGLRGLPKQRCAGGATSQCTPNLRYPAGSLHCQVQPLLTSPSLPTGLGAPLTSAPAAHRSRELYESTLVVEGVLGEKACTLRLRGQGSYDERYVSLHHL